MRLAIVTPFPPSITGIGQYGYYVARSLAQSGKFSRITVLAGSLADGESPNHLGSTEIEYAWKPNSWKARPAILSGLKRLKPDLVWFNLGASIFGRSPWINLSGLVTPIFAKRLEIPTVITLHELVEFADLRALNAPGGILASWGARALTKIATQADVVCLTMKHYADLLRARRVDCLHIPIGAYHEPEILPESDSQEILFFSTLAPFKGLELLLEAYPRLRKLHPQLKLTVAGTHHTRFPNYASEMEGRFAGVEGLNWLNQVNEDQVKELFCRAQILVAPYTASTGSSSVIYQAATWGRPIVATDLVEIKCLAQENNLQIQFFEKGSSAALFEAVELLMDSPGRRNAQARHNFNAMLRLRPEETGRHYLAAFNRALEKRKSEVRIAVAETG